MSNVFCGKCGAQASGGKFCGSCGAPLPSAEPTSAADETRIQEAPATPPAQPPYEPPAQYQQPEPQQYQQPPAPQWGQPQYQQPQYQQPQYQQPQYQPPAQQWGAQQPYAPAPSAPMVNPFKGMPVTDIARDLGALFLLFAALALPWDFTEDASGRWWVVIATIISALSVGVPYLVTLNVIPGWGAAQSRLVKYVAFVPFGASVLAALINELTHVGDDRELSQLAYFGLAGKQIEDAIGSRDFDLGSLLSAGAPEGGIGPAVFVGLAGALLAMQARRSDEETTGASDALWRNLVFGLVGFGTAVFAITTLIAMATDFGEDTSVALILGVAVGSLGGAAVLGLGLGGLLRGGREWARVLAVTGFTVVAVQFIGGVSDSYNPLFGAYFEGIGTSIGSFVAIAGIALLVARQVQRRLQSFDPVTSWVQTARYAGFATAVALGVAAISRLLIMIGLKNEDEDAVTGTSITAIVLLVVAAGLAIFISSLLAGNPNQARKIVVGLAGAIYLLAIVDIAVGRSGDFYGPVSALETVGWFALPGLILFSLLYPEEIRKTFMPIAGPPPGYQQMPQQGYPQQPPAGYQPPQQQPPAGYQPPQQPPQV